MPGSANLNIMLKTARLAGRSLSKDFREVENLQVSRKVLVILSVALTLLQKILFEMNSWKHGRLMVGLEKKVMQRKEKIRPDVGLLIR